MDIRAKDASTPSGVSFPSVQLSGATSISPFRNTPKEGLILYNPQDRGTTGTSNFVPKGFNYWSGNQWVPLLQYNWLRQGTTSTIPKTNEDVYTGGRVGIGDFST